MDKLAVFVDVQNVYYTVKEKYGCHFNYRALWQQLTLMGEIVTAYAYAIDRSDSQQRKFQQILRDIGFEVKLKPFIQRRDGSAKGDWDVGITIDVIESVANVDHVVLVSGDGDFDLLLQHVMGRHTVNTTVIGVPGLTADSLMETAGQFWPIEGGLLLG